MQEKKKILIVSQHFWPENFRINDLVEGLKSRDHHITILTGEPNYPDGFVYQDYKDNSGAYKTYCESEVIRVRVIPRGKRFITLFLNFISFMFSASTVGLFKLRNRKFDVVFVFLPSPITAAIPAILYKKFNKTPIYTWVMDLWPDTLVSLGYLKSKSLIKVVKVFVKYIYRNSTAILVQSEEFSVAIEKYVDKRKIKYFPNWSESIFYDESEPSNILDSKDSFNILFAGNIGASQDFDSLISAVKLVPLDKNIVWNLVGAGRYKETLEKLIKENQLGSRIKLLGSFELNEMPSLYQEADALYVSLKASENFSQTIPGKVQTYMASGKPILAMIDGATNNLIKKAKCGVVCPAGDFTQLAESAIKLSKLSLIEKNEMGKNGKIYFFKNFSRSRMLDKLEDIIYEDLT